MMRIAREQLRYAIEPMELTRKRIERQTAVAVVSLAALFAACGDDGSKGSGVSASKKAGEVTQEESKKLCLWTYEQTEGIEFSDRDLCELGAVQLSDSASECSSLVDACLKDPSSIEDITEGDGEGPDCDDADTASLPEGCEDITVGDYEACMRSIIDAWKRSFSSVSCSDREVPSLSDVADSLPKACDRIGDSCPELLPSDVRSDSEISGLVSRLRIIRR